MKNFNGHSSHGHHGSKAPQTGANTHIHVDHTYSLTHLHQHSYNHFVWSSNSAITELGIKFLFGRYQRGGGGGGVGANQSTWRSPPSDNLLANRYHILEEKIQHPGQDWYPQHWW